MRFNVAMVEASAWRSPNVLRDVARYVMFTLESLGHTVSIERNRCVRDRVNVIVGAHQLGGSGDAVDLLGPARDYVVLHTEGEVTGDRLRLYRGARAVWALQDFDAEALRREGLPARHLRLGWHHGLEEVAPRRQRDFDFLYVGELTPRRGDVLSKLSSRGYEVRVEADVDAPFRNDLLSRAEVVVTLRGTEAPDALPLPWLLFAIHHRVLVAGESGRGQSLYEDLFLWTDQDPVEHLKRVRARHDLRECAEEHYRRLRARPMTDLLAPLVAELEPARSPSPLRTASELAPASPR